MDVGVMVPQGWKGEFDGWDAAEAWDTAVARARQAEALGFESIWVFDHFTTVPEPTPGHLRVVHDARGAGGGDRPRANRAHGDLHGIPQPCP